MVPEEKTEKNNENYKEIKKRIKIDPINSGINHKEYEYKNIKKSFEKQYQNVPEMLKYILNIIKDNNENKVEKSSRFGSIRIPENNENNKGGLKYEIDIYMKKPDEKMKYIEKPLLEYKT